MPTKIKRAVGRALRLSIAIPVGSAIATTVILPATMVQAARAPATPSHAAAQAAGLRALHLCSGYFSTQAPRDLTDATVFADAPEAGAEAAKPVVDDVNRRISVAYASTLPPRQAVYRQGVGCTLLPIGADASLVSHLSAVQLTPPDLDHLPWPQGDNDAIARLKGASQERIEQLFGDAFKDEHGPYGGETWGLVVLSKGKIVAEDYRHGYGPHIAARTNSMCKSLGATIVGVGVGKGLLDLARKAPLTEWQTPGDPRGSITLNDLLHMASGLYSDGPQDPQTEIYQSGAAISEIAARNMMDSAPGQRFVYAGTDNNLATRALREAMADDKAYAEFPYRQLLWKIGMTRTVVEADWNNDFITSGQCWSTARDFARLGLLYLADGVWKGERLLPAGWSHYVRTPAPAQPVKPSIGGDAGYGAQFWLFGGMEGLPADTFAAFGARGQYAVIIPSRDLVVVRRGFDRASDFKIQRFVADIIAALDNNKTRMVP